MHGNSSLKVRVQTAFRSRTYMLSSPGYRNLKNSLLFELSNFITNWKELANFDLLYTVRSLWPVFQRKLSRRRLPITFVYFLSHASTKVLRPIKFAQRSRSIFLMSIDRKNTLVENFELLISSKYINIFIRSQSKMLYVSREACCRKTIFTSTWK